VWNPEDMYSVPFEEIIDYFPDGSYKFKPDKNEQHFDHFAGYFLTALEVLEKDYQFAQINLEKTCKAFSQVNNVMTPAEFAAWFWRVNCERRILTTAFMRLEEARFEMEGLDA